MALRLSEGLGSTARGEATEVLMDDAELAALVLENARLFGTRSLQIDRIGYDVYYRVKGNEVVVLALWHSHRAKRPRV